MIRRWGRTYRHSDHRVVWFPFGLLVDAKLGGRLRRLDVADYQNTGLRVEKRREHIKLTGAHGYLACNIM